MKIKTVEYKRLVSFGNFENHTVGAVAEVDEGESPEGALDKLKDWVIREATEVVLVQNIEAESHCLDGQLEAKRNEIGRFMKEAEQRWEATKKALAAHGVDVTDIEIPF